MLRRTLAALCAATALFATTADAATIQEFGGLASNTNGIALGPDGNVWVAEQVNGSVARMTPAGQVLQRYAVGSGPTSVAAGPGGRVWVAVTGASKLVWFDATAPAPSPHAVATECGPVAITAGGDDRMYFSLPCATPKIGTVAADGTGPVVTQSGRGKAYDLVATAGKLFVPDFDGDVVRRLALGTLAIETTVYAPGGGNPDGIAADGAGNVWVTLYGSGGVGRFPATQTGGAFAALAGGTLTNPFGIAAGADGRMYVAGPGGITRISPDGAFRLYPTGGEPFDVAAGPDGDVYVTDQVLARVLRLVSGAPRASTGAATAVAATAASATATVDPRGNATTVVFDYGPTPAYGATSAPVVVPAGVDAVPVTAVLSGLSAGATYHVRVRAANEEGEATGADTVVTTPPAPASGPRVLAARASFSWAFIGARTALTRVEIAGLRGGETATITCKGKGCAFKSKTYRKLKKGKKKLSALFGRKRKLATGTRVEVRVTAPDAVGSSAVLVVRKRQRDPKITRTCLQPGARATSRCP